jgi:hypothetical protein
MNRDEIGRKFKDDILEVALEMATNGTDVAEVKPCSSAAKLYREVDQLELELMQIGIGVVYKNTPYQAAVLTAIGANSTKNIETIEQETLNAPLASPNVEANCKMPEDCEDECKEGCMKSFDGENLT